MKNKRKRKEQISLITKSTQPNRTEKILFSVFFLCHSIWNSFYAFSVNKTFSSFFQFYLPSIPYRLTSVQNKCACVGNVNIKLLIQCCTNAWLYVFSIRRDPDNKISTERRYCSKFLALFCTQEKQKPLTHLNHFQSNGILYLILWNFLYRFFSSDLKFFLILLLCCIFISVSIYFPYFLLWILDCDVQMINAVVAMIILVCFCRAFNLYACLLRSDNVLYVFPYSKFLVA